MGPHFFKVVVSPISQGIKFPRAFTRKYGDELKRSVVLHVPTGVSWLVELLRDEDRIWLHKGWLEFAQHYGIQQYHFLIFRYEGGSRFHVIICDKTGLEIDYGVESNHNQAHGKKDPVSVSDDDEDAYVGRGGETNLPRSEGRPSFTFTLKETHLLRMSFPAFFARQTRLRDNEVISLVNPKVLERKYKIRVFEGKKDGRFSTGQGWAEFRDDSKLAVGRKYTITLVESDQDDETMFELKSDEDEEGIDLSDAQNGSPKTARTKIHKGDYLSYRTAKAFASENPFFISFMQPTYVYGYCYMCFKLDFAGDYLPKQGHFDLKLRVEGCRKAWTVRCTVVTNRGKMIQGWKEFVRDNNLVVGDACVFELISRDFGMIKVVIYRNHQNKKLTTSST